MTTHSTTVRPITATLVLGLGTLVTHGFGLSLVPAMLPRIAEDFGAGYGVLGITVAAGLVAYSSGALVAGRLLDRLPVRALLMGSYTGTGLGLLAAAAAGSPATLTVATVILGLAAPVSWAATLHAAGVTMPGHTRAAVMSGASGGAAVGVLINGALVQTSATIHPWEVSFLVAAAVAIVPTVWGFLVFRDPIPGPTSTDAIHRSGFRDVLDARAGRVAVVAAAVAGVGGFTFSAFLTATAIDELGVGSARAAALWWLIGVVGALASPFLGRLSDRLTPLRALTIGAAAYAIGLVVLSLTWSYAGLVAAAVGYTIMNYPIWGVLGALTNRHFDTSLAVRAISLGLISAALLGAGGNVIAGAWIDNSGSFRGPVVVITSMMIGLVAWFAVIERAGGLGDGADHTPTVGAP